jgi:hypothetical protein
MDTLSPSRTVVTDTVVTHSLHHRSRLSWPAILGGLCAAMAMQVIFMMLGAGLGFAIYHPITSDNPVEDLGTGAIVVPGLSAVFSLWFGGWIAGRFTPVASRSSGNLHGFLVWCAATVAGVIVVSAGAGWITGDLSKLVGGGLSAAGRPAAAAVSGAADLAKEGAKSSTDTLASFVDEAVANRAPDAPRATSVRAKREVGLALARLFNPTQKEKMAENKAALLKVLVDDAGLKQADAERIVNEWTDSYNRLRADLEAAKVQAEAKAREAADKAAKVLAVFSLCAFVAFVLGAFSAACGGRHGAKCALRHDTLVVS